MIKDYTRQIKNRLKERNMKEYENNELSNAFKKLKSSPIFAMSLGSKNYSTQIFGHGYLIIIRNLLKLFP